MKNRIKYYKIALIIILVVISILVAGAFLFSHFARKKIREAELKGYELRIEKISTNLFLRQVAVRKVEILSKKSKNRYVIPRAQVNGIKLSKLVFSKKLAADKLIVKSPEITLHKNQNREESERSASGSGKNSERTFLFNKVEISGIDLVLLNSNEEKPDTSIAALLNTEVWNFTNNTDSSGFFTAGFGFERVNLLAEKSKFRLKRGFYELTLDTTIFDSENPDLIITKTRLTSPYSKYEIGQVAGVETDWYNLQTDSIIFNKINLKSLIKDTVLIFGHGAITNLNGTAFRDKRLPFPEKPDTKLPMQLIDALPFPFHADSVSFRNADIEYQERVEDADEAGKIRFKQLNGTVTNLSNIDSLINGPTEFTAKADVMDKAELNARFIFPNTKYPHKYEVKGNLQPTNISLFNPMLVPNAAVRVETGQVNQLSFNFTFNAVKSSGDMVFQYEDLKFFILNRKNNSERKINTFFMDKLAIRNNNTKNRNSYRTGEISFERDPKKSVFNYWWKSLFSGIKSIVVVF